MADIAVTGESYGGLARQRSPDQDPALPPHRRTAEEPGPTATSLPAGNGPERHHPRPRRLAHPDHEADRPPAGTEAAVAAGQAGVDGGVQASLVAVGEEGQAGHVIPGLDGQAGTVARLILEGSETASTGSPGSDAAHSAARTGDAPHSREEVRGEVRGELGGRGGI